MRRIGTKLSAESMRRFGAKLGSNVRAIGTKLSSGVRDVSDFAQRAAPVAAAAASMIPGGQSFVPLIHSVNSRIQGFRRGYDKLNNMIQSV
jgi:hypothetical protein